MTKTAGPLAVLAVLGGTIWVGFPGTSDSLASRLVQEEGFRSHIYVDSRGFRTIGYGTNLEIGITRKEAEFLLRSRLADSYKELTNDLPWVVDLPSGTQEALLDMRYQIGEHGLLKFKKFLGLLESGKCEEARKEGFNSAWARETPVRARRVLERLCSAD